MNKLFDIYVFIPSKRNFKVVFNNYFNLYTKSKGLHGVHEVHFRNHKNLTVNSCLFEKINIIKN